jgi:hypothetical protein
MTTILNSKLENISCSNCAIDNNDNTSAEKINRMFYKSAVACFFGIILFITGTFAVLPPLTTVAGRISQFTLGIITLAVMSYSGLDIYKTALRSLSHK